MSPLFYVLRVSQAAFNAQAANEVLGLTGMFGGSLDLAEAIAPQPEVVMVLGDEVPALMTEFVICQTCFLLRPLYMAGLMDQRIEDAEENPA